jgi:hypothetical protein
MDCLRITAQDGGTGLVPCCRCGNDQRPWDRIAGQAYCPNCQEILMVGEAEPVAARPVRRRCAACGTLGTVCYATFPLRSPAAVEMDLCPEHMRGILARRLGAHAFHQLCRQLHGLGFQAADIFLLHDVFYDPRGRALHPLDDPV